MSAQRVVEPRAERALVAERRIGRTLIAVTYVSVALLVVGVALGIAAGIAPLSGGPPLDMAALVQELVGLEPAGYLWLGLIVVIAAPISRVALAAYAYAREGDRMMVGVAIAILATIAVGIASAVAATV